MFLSLRGISLLAAAASALGACKSIEVPKLPGVTPYRMVIQQGNFISDDMVAQLKPGMSKEQVRFVLGTPLVTEDPRSPVVSALSKLADLTAAPAKAAPSPADAAQAASARVAEQPPTSRFRIGRR